MTRSNKVYWTSRKVKLGEYKYETQLGWIYKVGNKESRVYKTKDEAEREMLLHILTRV